MTFRDDVWSTVIQRLCTTDGFTTSDLGFEEDDRHTARLVLKEMEKHEWLARESPSDVTWKPGPATLAHLDRQTEGE